MKLNELNPYKMIECSYDDLRRNPFLLNWVRFPDEKAVGIAISNPNVINFTRLFVRNDNKSVLYMVECFSSESRYSPKEHTRFIDEEVNI